MGNLVPGILSFPLAAAGVCSWDAEDPSRPLPMLLLAAFPVVGWLALATFGLWSNDAMRDELGKRFGRERGRPDLPMQFIGLATPAHRSVMDPHMDVAFLILHPEELEIYGEVVQLSLRRELITSIKLVPNTHSWVGLGGFIRIETSKDVVLIESREQNMLFGARRRRLKLNQKLLDWRRFEKSS